MFISGVPKQLQLLGKKLSVFNTQSCGRHCLRDIPLPAAQNNDQETEQKWGPKRKESPIESPPLRPQPPSPTERI